MQTINWFQPQAYKTISNSHGMEIMLNETAEEVYYKYTNDNIAYNSFINYDQDGDPYFMDMRSKTVYYLSEFLKISK